MTFKDRSQLYDLREEIKIENDRINDLDDELEILQKRRDRLLSSACFRSGFSFSGTKSSVSASKQERYMDSIDELERQEKALIQKINHCRIILVERMSKAYEERERLERFISSVDNSYVRHALELRFIDGRSWPEVARKTGRKSPSAVRMMCSRYLKER